MEEPKDSEDVYQDYVWKVDKIYSHHRRGRNTFVHVQRKQDNRSWISLKSLWLHDPYSCVIYAVTKKLFQDEDWSWIMDFIDDSHAYTKILNVLKTSKAMGPKYKFGVEIPKSVKHAVELDQKMATIFGKKQWRKNLLS